MDYTNLTLLDCLNKITQTKQQMAYLETCKGYTAQQKADLQDTYQQQLQKL